MRTKAVVKIIENEKPDIVFLQEVIPKTLDYLQENLPQYKFIPGCSVGYLTCFVLPADLPLIYLLFYCSSYFSVTLLSVFTMYYDSHDVIEFPSSTMGRNLIKVKVNVTL